MHRKQSFDQQRRQQHHTLVPVGLQDKVRDYRTQRGPPAVCHLTRNGTADRFRKAKTSSNRTMPAMILSPGPREKKGGHAARYAFALGHKKRFLSEGN